MGALLIDAWLAAFGRAEVVSVLDEASVSLVRESIRAAGAGAALPPTSLEELIAAASELAQNQLAHAVGGVVAVRLLDDGGGLEVLAADRGRGIPEPARALSDAPAAATGSLGVGLAAARRLSDEMDVDVRIGEGTCVRLRKLSGPRQTGLEIGVFGFPCEGERVSGDDAACVWQDGQIVLVLSDGLGHGSEAREASRRCVAGAAATAVGAVDDFLRAAHQRLQGTRGAATTIARIDPTASSLEIAGAGNVQGVLVPPRARDVRRFASTPFVLGSAGTRAPTFRVERTSRVRGDTIILYTDGISSRADVAAEATAFGEHPVAIAERIARSHSRAGDDVLVIVAR